MHNEFRGRTSRNTDEMVNALAENCSDHVSMSAFKLSLLLNSVQVSELDSSQTHYEV